jgi:hypothetical protein
MLNPISKPAGKKGFAFMDQNLDRCKGKNDWGE